MKDQYTDTETEYESNSETEYETGNESIYKTESEVDKNISPEMYKIKQEFLNQNKPEMLNRFNDEGIFLKKSNFKYFMKSDLIKILCLTCSNMFVNPCLKRDKSKLLEYLSSKYQIPYQKRGYKTIEMLNELLEQMIPPDSKLVDEEYLEQKFNK